MFDGNMEHIGIWMAFVEGLISFFSPCVLPLLPIYLGYFSGNLEDEKPSRKKTLFFTLSFILGIFAALILLNISITWISSFFHSASVWMMRIGGLLIVFLGLVQLGVFRISFLQKTFHISVNFAGKRMNPVLAFVMGFTFSFSWTPCIGPALASILILASNTGSFFSSLLLIICYAIGFALPFLILGFFAKEAVLFMRRHDTVLQVIVKVGAIILILMGILMFSGYLSILGGGTGGNSSGVQGSETTEDRIMAPQFALQNQYGETVPLSDFEGKVVYVNFWATWCTICVDELDAIQALYDKYKDSDDVAVITLVYPDSPKETDMEGIQAFLKERNLTFPVLFDTSGEAFMNYGISAFPTSFLIDRDQSIYGQLSGGVSLETMEDVIRQTKEGVRYK
ncbi:MAG: redoxin domain-containing protein [Erysipelotrichaceae bacterium]|nr:redoxin domain-containing protein [Erysipelotrichaceae bacterium]